MPDPEVARGRMFSALGDALEVHFVDTRPGEWRDLDGVVVGTGEIAVGVGAAEAGVPAFVALGDVAAKEGVVAFGNHEWLDPTLHDAQLTDQRGAGRPVPTSPGDVVLASCQGRPRWVVRDGRGAPLMLAALPLDKLDEEEPLRDALKAGRFLSLLPLVHFVRGLTSDHGWTAPPLRAAFMFDDPNLHWRSYGYIRYREMVRRAELEDFHATMAMTPLDAAFAHPGATRVFREAARYLSLVVHGNDHVRGELKRPRTEEEALEVVGQALRRVTAFERRTGVTVSRVMVPPHGGCSRLSLRALSQLGFEALCGTRIRPNDRWEWADMPLVEWEPCQFAPGGLPTFTRHSLTDPYDDLVLRAYLRQPLLIYGHHVDLSEGMDVLSRASTALRTIGPVRWGSLTDIVRSNFATRREGGVLAIRLFCRRAAVTIPDGVEAIRVELPRSARDVAWSGVRIGSSLMTPQRGGAGYGTEPSPVTPGETLELFARVEDALEVDAVGTPQRSLWPIVRRGLTEGRDRLTPVAPVLRRRLAWQPSIRGRHRFSTSRSTNAAKGKP